MKKAYAMRGTPLVGGQAVIIERGLVNVNGRSIRRYDSNVQRRAVEDLSKLHFLLSDLLFRSLTLGDILARDQDAGIVPPQDRPGRFANPEHRAVFPFFAEFPPERLAEPF